MNFLVVSLLILLIVIFVYLIFNYNNKSGFSELYDELEKCDRNNPEHWLKISDIYMRLANGYSISYNYKTDRWGNKLFDKFDLYMIEVCEQDRKYYRDKYMDYIKNKTLNSE